MADFTRKIPDNEAHERIMKALEVLGEEPGVTLHGHGALEMSRRTLRISAVALMKVQNKQDDEAVEIRRRAEGLA